MISYLLMKAIVFMMGCRVYASAFFDFFVSFRPQYPYHAAICPAINYRLFLSSSKCGLPMRQYIDFTRSKHDWRCQYGVNVSAFFHTHHVIF